jgi:hypothetical protein
MNNQEECEKACRDAIRNLMEALLNQDPKPPICDVLDDLYELVEMYVTDLCEEVDPFAPVISYEHP